jgi:hypothetical protein
MKTSAVCGDHEVGGGVDGVAKTGKRGAALNQAKEKV